MANVGEPAFSPNDFLTEEGVIRDIEILKTAIDTAIQARQRESVLKGLGDLLAEPAVPEEQRWTVREILATSLENAQQYDLAVIHRRVLAESAWKAGRIEEAVQQQTRAVHDMTQRRVREAGEDMGSLRTYFRRYSRQKGAKGVVTADKALQDTYVVIFSYYRRLVDRDKEQAVAAIEEALKDPVTAGEYVQLKLVLGQTSGELEERVEHLTDAIEVAIDHQFYYEAALGLSTKAMLHVDQGDFDRAICEADLLETYAELAFQAGIHESQIVRLEEEYHTLCSYILESREEQE